MKTTKVKKVKIVEEPKNETLLVECECCNEILSIYWSEMFGFDFAIYRFDSGSSFLNRLRLIWRIIITGRPYSDQMCISEEDAAKIVDFITRCNKRSKQCAQKRR